MHNYKRKYERDISKFQEENLIPMEVPLSTRTARQCC